MIIDHFGMSVRREPQYFAHTDCRPPASSRGAIDRSRHRHGPSGDTSWHRRIDALVSASTDSTDRQSTTPHRSLSVPRRRRRNSRRPRYPTRIVQHNTDRAEPSRTGQHRPTSKTRIRCCRSASLFTVDRQGCHQRPWSFIPKGIRNCEGGKITN